MKRNKWTLYGSLVVFFLLLPTAAPAAQHCTHLLGAGMVSPPQRLPNALHFCQ